MRAAHNVNSLTERAHINDIVGTGIGTKSAAHTFFGSNFCQSVFHVDSPIGTDAYAVAQTDTAVFAAPHSAVKALCIGTGLHAVKIKGVLFGIAVARASYNGYFLGNFHGSIAAHYVVHLGSHLCSAGAAEVCGSALFNYRLGIIGAAAVAAGSAVYLRKRFVYLFGSWVGLYLKKL